MSDEFDFEAELQRLAATNHELLGEYQAEHSDAEPVVTSELDELRRENAELRARIEQLELSQNEEGWLERQREYEMLLEEKSQVIRELHQKLQETHESVSVGDTPLPGAGSGARLGQAEEILRLKRELEEQRRQLEQDEQDMIAQMRQMELQMAKERAEMARQRQEVQRIKEELEREAEQGGRDQGLRERLQGLNRTKETRQTPPIPPAKTSSGIFRRIFG